MSLILPANSLAVGGYEIANSLRFNSGSSDYLNRTPASSGSLTTWTFSTWIKRANISSSQQMILMASPSGGNDMQLNFGATDQIEFFNRSGGSVNGIIYTNARYRDVSAWYHIVFVWDTTNATAGNRMRLYVNGEEVTSFETDTNPPLNTTSFVNGNTNHKIGQAISGSASFNGYMSETYFIDGQQLTPEDFGEFDADSGIWKPIPYAGTYGTNGFYLEFQDSGALGTDTSGNGNNFTVNNLTSIDQVTDTPTNNFATLNVLDNAQSSATYSEGNLKWSTTTNSHYFWGRSIIGVSTGKWYFEAKLTSAMEHGYIGICVDAPDDNTTFLTNGGANDEFEWGYKLSDGRIYNNIGDSAYGSTYTTGDIIGVYLDLDNNKLYFAKNGTIQNSGTGISITSPASTSTGNYFFCVSDGTSGTSGTWEANFGNPTFTISSGNTDPNGYGNFEYDPSAGTFDGVSKSFYALNTKNLAEFG
jgi:hypothetical protein